MHVPVVRFSAWTRWDARESLREIRFKGVYIIADFDKPPVGAAYPRSGGVIYIGETCKKTLHQRLNQFGRSAFQGKKGHSGGVTYHKNFHGARGRLYVAAFPVNDLPPIVAPFFTRHIERRLLWEYVKTHGKPPVCNQK